MKLLDVAIVGGSTLLGKELKELLESSDFPLGGLRLLSLEEEDEPGLSARLTDFAGEALVEIPIVASDLAACDVTFLCESRAATHPALAAARLVVDLAGEAHDGGVLTVAGVNEPPAKSKWIRCPRSATVLLAHLLAPLLRGGRGVSSATVLLGASNAGRAGVDELMAQSRAALNMGTGPTDVFAAQLAFNLLPPFDGAASLERIVQTELAEILGSDAQVPVAIVRVPIFFGIACCLYVRGIAREEALRALRGGCNLAFRLEEDATALDVPGQDAVIVGRIQADAKEEGIWIWALCDNARRGGALNALEAARSVLMRRASE